MLAACFLCCAPSFLGPEVGGSRAHFPDLMRVIET